MYMDLLAAALVLFLTFMMIENKKEPKKLFGIYAQPGKWYFIKYPLFLALLVLRRLKYYVVGKKMFDEAVLERRKPLSDDPKAFDAVFFHGVSQDGIFFVAGAERRHAGIINGLIYVQHPELGLLKSLKLPDTKLQEDASFTNGWAAEGLRFTPVEAMKRWDINFDGKMRVHGKEDKIVRVKITAQWTSDLQYYHFDVDIPAKSLARSFAREPWTKDFFESLKEAHQSHYEQMGDMSGTITVDGKDMPLKLEAFRDHSYGKKRDWKLMHRYIYQMFYLSNQTRIVVALISQPCTASHYEMGYVVHANGKIDSIVDCDMRLWQHGESGKPSDDLCFTFTATDDHIYECKVKYSTTVSHFVGNNEDVKMYERFGDVEVNGVKGKVISEWNYSNTTGKFNLNQYHC